MNELEKKAIDLSLELVSEINEYSFSHDSVEILEKYIDYTRIAAAEMDLRNLFIKHTKTAKMARQWLLTLSNSK